MLAPHKEIRHKKQGVEKSDIVGFSRMKTNKCRNPSRACTPGRNLSPPLRPLTLACAHVPTNQHQIWSDLRFLSVSFSYVFLLVWHRHLRWATSFSHYKNRGFRRILFFVLGNNFVFFLCPIICQFSKNIGFCLKRGCKIWVFQISVF